MRCRVQLPADNRLMVVFHLRAVHRTVVFVPAEAVVRIGLAVPDITDILFIIQNTHDRCGTPLAAPARLHTPAVQFLADLMRPRAGNNRLENELDNLCFRRDNHISAVAV